MPGRTGGRADHRPIPAKGILALRRITNVQLAEAYGCSVYYISLVLNGYFRASEPFRGWLPDYLDLPRGDLLDDESRREAIKDDAA